jgi:hypothetical protein
LTWSIFNISSLVRRSDFGAGLTNGESDDGGFEQF